MPGSNARALEKARTLAADALILDLEDAVAPEAKDAARGAVAAALATGGFGRREVIVRINQLESPWGVDDIMSLTLTPPNAVLLPKVENPHEIEKLDLLMDRFGVTDRTMIWCMLETPKGVLNARAIAAATPRLQCLVMGTSDLAKDLRAPPDPGRMGLITSLGLCLLAARAAGADILDGVHLDLDDDAGFEAACRQGVELGFDGKTLIHPKQIEACNRIFQPAVAEIERAKRIIAAFSEARAKGLGVAVLDGRLIEHLHVESARRTVALAEAIAAVSGLPTAPER
jgi:citrate lyase subunit beta/citryl-CoA lyase